MAVCCYYARDMTGGMFPVSMFSALVPCLFMFSRQKGILLECQRETRVTIEVKALESGTCEVNGIADD